MDEFSWLVSWDRDASKLLRSRPEMPERLLQEAHDILSLLPFGSQCGVACALVTTWDTSIALCREHAFLAQLLHCTYLELGRMAEAQQSDRDRLLNGIQVGISECEQDRLEEDLLGRAERIWALECLAERVLAILTPHLVGLPSRRNRRIERQH